MTKNIILNIKKKFFFWSENRPKQVLVRIYSQNCIKNARKKFFSNPPKFFFMPDSSKPLTGFKRV